MALLFWLALAFVAYVYVGYPLLLHLWARLKTRGSGLGARTTSSEQREASPDTPTVSFVIAGRNEGGRILGRVENIEALDYPADKRQVILVSDGSTDNTHQVFERL